MLKIFATAGALTFLGGAAVFLATFVWALAQLMVTGHLSGPTGVSAAGLLLMFGAVLVFGLPLAAIAALRRL